MQAYLAIRPSHKNKTVVRDLKPGGFASLVLGHPSGDATVYELTLDGGAVRLTVKYPGQETKTLCIEAGTDSLSVIPFPVPEQLARDARACT